MNDMQSRLSKMIVQLKYLLLCDFILSTSCTSKEEILLIVTGKRASSNVVLCDTLRTYFSCWFQCTNVWYRHPANVKFGISLHANCQISTCRQTNFAVFFFSGCYFFLFMQSVGAFPFSLEDNFSESSSNIYVMSYNSVFVLFRLTLGKVSVFSFFVVHFVTFRASVIPSWA